MIIGVAARGDRSAGRVGVGVGKGFGRRVGGRGLIEMVSTRI
jgi:hypothetical protein